MPTPPRSASPTSAAVAARTRQDRGFWLDLREGNWLTDKQAADSPVDTDGLVSTDDVQEKEKVTPYVEDRRNLLVIRLTHAVEDEVAVTLRAALERAIEAEFQLEDSELDSRELPDLDQPRPDAAHRGRRGWRRRPRPARRGARRLGPGRTPSAEHRPLRPRHRRRPGPRPGIAGTLRARLLRLPALLRQPVRAQPHRPARRRPAAAASWPGSSVSGGAGGRDTRRPARVAQQPARLRVWRRSSSTGSPSTGRRLPDDAQRTVEQARARPDFVYDLPGNPVAVFIDGPHHDDAIRQQRDDEAGERLEDLGWTVVRLRHDDDWTTIADRYQWLFGPGRSTPTT